MGLRCACTPAMLAVPLLAAAAVPEHYPFSPATGRYSWATALNDEGRYDVNSATPDIPYQVASIQGDLNERGELLVSYLTEGEGDRTAVYSNGKLTDLPRYGGQQLYSNAINDAGRVTGYFMTAEGRTHAFLYDGATTTDLDPDAVNATGHDINNLGEVAGVANGRAVLYADGEVIDLDTLIDPEADLLLKSADDNNNRGQILAHSCDRSGVFCYGSVLLSPVPAIPEPSAPLMLPAGLALVARRRHGGGVLRYKTR